MSIPDDTIVLEEGLEKVLSGYMKREEQSVLVHKDPSQLTLLTQHEDYNSVQDDGDAANAELSPLQESKLQMKTVSSKLPKYVWQLIVITMALLGMALFLLNSGPPSSSLPNTPKIMVPLEWDKDNITHMEFCQSGDVYGYRLPGDQACGPAGLMIRLTPGQSYRLVLHNTAGTITNVHTHGLHVSGSGNADDVTRMVEPENCLIYDWDIPANAMGGTFWLHAHPQGNAMEQVQGGAYSMLIVEDNPQLLDAVASEQQPIVQTWLQNELLLIAYTNGGKNTTAFVPEPLQMEQGVWYRLRLMTVDPRGKRMPVDFPEECHVHLAATDGVWLPQVPSPDNQHRFNPTGASRLDVAISCPHEGQYDIKVHNTSVTTIHVHGQKSNILANPFVHQQPWQPTFPSYLRDSSFLDESLLEQHSFVLINRTINGQYWDPTTPLFSVDYNSYQEWTLTGTNVHPFHTHVFHMQTFGCPPHIDGQFYDTVLSESDDCRVRFHVQDFAERVVVHCHNVLHEDQGMMIWFNVTNGGPIQDASNREEMTCQYADRALRPVRD